MDEHESSTAPKRFQVARRSPVIVIAIAAVAMLASGIVTSRGVAAGAETTPSPQITGYLPSISDLMIATIQPRHERLWRAGQDGNWNFAAYELGNLHGAFGRIGQAHPTTQNISFPQMVTSVTEQPIAELKTAIQSKDAAAFTKAYADLTDACNSCHQALNHGVVEIVVPRPTSAPDLKAGSAPRN
jgi:hypothetical protein